jgi:hypothetical protein
MGIAHSGPVAPPCARAAAEEKKGSCGCVSVSLVHTKLPTVSMHLCPRSQSCVFAVHSLALAHEKPPTVLAHT